MKLLEHLRGIIQKQFWPPLCFCHGKLLNGKECSVTWCILMADWIRRSWASLQQGVSTVSHSWSSSHGNLTLTMLGFECNATMDS